MYKPKRYTNKMILMINNSLIDLPTPSNISNWWNLGSLLGMCLILQMMTGIMVSMHYSADPQTTYTSMINIMSNVNSGWLLRCMHANGASMFFVCLYLHTGRGMFYSSYKLTTTWTIGVIILLTTMATAFLGYVLPWGQMSLWGATVITNLISTIPYIGNDVINWLWGGFSISKPTLTRFFTMHFMLPFLIITMVMIHLMFLHSTGSNNPLGLSSNLDKMPFHPPFSSSDTSSFIITLSIFIYVNLMFPLFLNDPDNFTHSNPLVTPTHIQPEWYFLFAYAILRSIPNKLGGVIALIMAITILFIMPMSEKSKFKSKAFYPFNKNLFWLFTINIVMLTWIGAQSIETPFIWMGQMMTCFHFSYFVMNPLMLKLWDNTIS
nr:cytochrome b [Peloridora minuta]